MKTVLFCQLADGDEFLDRQNHRWKKAMSLRRLNAVEVIEDGVIPKQTFFSATTQVTKVDEN